MRLTTMFSAMILIIGIIAPASAQTPEIAEKIERDLTQRRLQGAWLPDMIITTEGAQKYPIMGRSLVFNGTTVARLEGNHIIEAGNFKFDDGFLRLTISDRNPWDVEWNVVRDKVQYAYKVDGDLLTLCYTVGNKGKAGDLTPGDGRTVVVYKRQVAENKPAKKRERP